MFELKEVTCITAQSVTTGIFNAFLKDAVTKKHIMCYASLISRFYKSFSPC